MKKHLLVLLALLFFACDPGEDCNFRIEYYYKRTLPNCEISEANDCRFWEFISREDVAGCHLEKQLEQLHDSVYFHHRSNNMPDRPIN